MILAVTNRKLCKEDFLVRIEKIARAKPEGIILREKDLAPEAYRALALACRAVCDREGIPLILNGFYGQAAGFYGLQLSSAVFERQAAGLGRMLKKGVSVHSAEEGERAELLGADYLIAGHIFATDCKKDLAPRGLNFLKQVCERVRIPVFAIGGISAGNIGQVLEAGAAGGCVMSGLMRGGEPEEVMEEMRKGIEEAKRGKR